jgi:hypothetical protein
VKSRVINLKYKNMLQVFCDGEKIFKEFQQKYITHKRGLFILAPSGTGKTYFVKNQKLNDWIDGDELWLATNAQPQDEWWEQGLEVIFEVDQKCDVITMQAKKLGFWIMGASNNWLMPDAIVLPDWRINKKYIIEREKNNYDGGAKSDSFQQVMNHRKYMKEISKKNKIPIFKTINEAVLFLTNL